jgi:soluble lytic murein transglycosylase
LHYEEYIQASAIRHRVNPYLVAAIINAESSWETNVKSAQGAVGLMQVLPSTAEQLARWKKVDAKRYPPEDLTDPEVNIEYGTAYFRYLVERYHEIETALAAYNAGLANADEWAKTGANIRDTIEFPETKHYVLRVVRGKDRYAALYPDAFGDWRP